MKKELKDLFVYMLDDGEQAENIVMAVSCLTSGHRQAVWDDVKDFSHDELLGYVGSSNAILMLEDRNVLVQDEGAEDEDVSHFLVYVEEN